MAFLKEVRSSDYRWRYFLSMIAFLWAICIAIFAIGKLAYILDSDLSEVISNFTVLRSFLIQVRMGQMLLLQFVIALLIVLMSQIVRTRNQFKLLGFMMLIGITPPALTGHSGNTSQHELAVGSWAVHIVSISVWCALVLALLFLVLVDQKGAIANVANVSRISLFCFAGTLLSGTINAWVRIPDISSLLSSTYGRILIAKSACFLIIGSLAVIYRTKILPKGEIYSNLFLRLLAIEVALMGLAIMFGVVLSETKFPIVKIVPN
jgi:putative copper resistance protein D